MRLPLLATALAALLLAGCGDNQDPSGADELWTRIHDEKYTSWMRAPGYASRTPSAAPHGDEVEIFVDDVVASALAGGAISAWPEGSLIVKDGYSGGEPHLVAAMEKRKGGWYWAEWDPDGSASFSGEPTICTDCHASGSDFVRAFALPE